MHYFEDAIETSLNEHIKSLEAAFQARTVPLDEVIPKSERVLLLKIDVQGWEYHVLKGASKLLSRKGSQAPYLIYEEKKELSYKIMVSAT